MVDYQEKIEKCEEQIAKKNALIEKRFKAIKKKSEDMNKAIADLGGDFVFEYSEDVDSLLGQQRSAENYIKAVGCPEGGDWNDNWYRVLWDYPYKIWDYIESIKNAKNDIEERKKILAKYQEQLDKANEKEQAIESMPKCIKEFMADWVKIWDSWDGMRRASVESAMEEVSALYKKEQENWQNAELRKEIRDEISEIRGLYSDYEWYELVRMEDEEIHERNVKAAKSMILDLYARVCHITGSFDDASELRISRDNAGYAIINGLVKGDKGSATVKSIGAGGYNIQRFHIRVLVHEVH